MINQYLLGHKVEVTDGKRIWYIAELSGFIMEVNLFSTKLKCIWKIPNFKDVCSYRLLFYYAHKLYIFPYYQKIMYIYDLYTAKYEKIEVKKCLKLMGCIKRNQFLYAFGSQSEILKFNIENNNITYIDIKKKIYDLENFSLEWFWTRSFVLDEHIYIPLACSNVIIVLDQWDNASSICLGEKTEKWILENFQADDRRFHVIHCKGEKNRVRTYIAEYDKKGKLISENSVEEKKSYQIYPFLNAIWKNEKWICFPFGRNEILLRDKKCDEILFTIDNGIDFLNDIIQGIFFCSVWADDDTVCSINQSTGSLLRIDINNLTVENSYLELTENLDFFAQKKYQDAIKFHYVIREVKEFYDLKSYINNICNNRDIQTNLENTD